MNIPALILDGIVVVIILCLIVKSYQKGLLRTLVSAIGHLVSCVVAYLGSRALAEACYRLFFRDKLIASIEQAIEGAAADADLSGQMNAVWESLPGYLQAMLSAVGVNASELSGQLSNQVEESARTMSVTITGTVLYPVIYMLLQGIFFLILFAACAVLVRCLVRVLKGVERIPVIGPVNALLGGAMGLIEGLVIVFVAAVAVRLLLDFTGGFSWLNSSIVNETQLFGVFYNFDLQTLPVFPA